ncbi:MAG: NAD-dependent epimerase/dehydratase family protein [Chloroflexota bacterium]
MKVLVTGVSGFLAPHVAAVAASRGHSVVGTDSRPATTPSYLSEPPWEEFRLCRLDDPDSAAAAVEGMDAVCHLAGVGDVYLAFERPDAAAAANVTATAILLEAARAEGVKKFVYASTWEVYGEPHYQPLDEKHPCEPDHPYNITKYAGERLALAFDRLKGLPGLALRLGTAYGRGMRPNSVFSIFIDRARKGEPITISGDGRQGRQFTHARDIGEAFRLAVESDLRGHALNTVAGQMVTIRELAAAVAARYPTDVTYGSPRPGDIAPASVDSSKAKRLLGWEASVPLAEGLAELLSERERGSSAGSQ